MEGEVLNISPVVVWVVALSQLLTFGLTIWGLMASGSRANARKIEEHDKRLDGHELRLGSVEQDIENGPSREDVQSIKASLLELKGDIRVLRAENEGGLAIMTRLEAIVSRHENHLLGGK